jgi:hypothetical protein
MTYKMTPSRVGYTLSYRGVTIDENMHAPQEGCEYDVVNPDGVPLYRGVAFYDALHRVHTLRRGV